MAAVGHGALKEGQIVNKLNEEYLKTKKAEITDKQALEQIAASESKERRMIIKRARVESLLKESTMLRSDSPDAVILFQVMK